MPFDKTITNDNSENTNGMGRMGYMFIVFFLYINFDLHVTAPINRSNHKLYNDDVMFPDVREITI